MDASGNAQTARKFLSNTKHPNLETQCKADPNCAGFVFNPDNEGGILYTTNGCTHNCSNTAWVKNPSLIERTEWCCGQFIWKNASCFRKTKGEY